MKRERLSQQVAEIIQNEESEWDEWEKQMGVSILSEDDGAADAVQEFPTTDDEDTVFEDTKRDVMAGICIWTCVFALAVFIVRDNKIVFLYSLLAGGILAGLSYMHMSYTVVKAVDEMSANATGYMRRQSLLRLLVIFAALAASAIFYRYLSLAGMFLGIFSLKPAIYSRDLVHKILNKKSGKGR